MPVSEQLELDGSDALSTIDTIESSLEQVATSFKVSLADALDVLSTVTVEDADATAVATAITESVGEGTATPAIIDADAAAVASDIEGAVSEGSASPAVIDADVGTVADEIEAAVVGADATVTIEADTSGLADAGGDVEGLDDSLGGLTDSAAQASTGLGGVADLSQVASGGLAVMGGNTKALIGSMGAAAGPIGVVVAGLALFTTAGLTGVQATERLNAVLGASAVIVENVNFDGVIGDLASLAQESGNSTPKLRESAAGIAELAMQAGASAPQAAALASNLNATALALTAANPKLGEAGDVSGQLFTAFQKGGPKLRKFGIDISATELKTAAANIAFADGRTKVTAFDLATAGLQITTKRLDLGGKFSDGIQTASTRFAAFKQSLTDTIVVAGQPFVDPILDALEHLGPLAVGVGESLGAIFELFLPAVAIVLPVVDVLADMFGNFADGLRIITDTIGPVGIGIGLLALALILLTTNFFAVTAAIEAMTAAMISNPFTLVLVGIAALVTVLGIFGGKTDEAAAKLNDFAKKLADVNGQMDVATAKAAVLAIEEAGLTDVLALAGISAKQWTDAITAMGEGASNTDPRISAVSDKINAQGTALDSAKGKWAEALRNYERTPELVDEVARALAAAGVTGDVATEGIEAFSQGVQDSDPRIRAVTEALQSQGRETDGLRGKLEGAGESYREQSQLNQDQSKIGANSLVEDAARIEEADKAKAQAEEDATAALEAFVKAAIEKLPTVSSVFAQAKSDAEQFGAALSPEQFAQRLIDSLAATTAFVGNLTELTRRGLGALVGILAEQGPVIAGAFTQNLIDAEPGVAQHLNTIIQLYQAGSSTAAADLARILGPEAAALLISQLPLPVGAAGAAGTAITTAFTGPIQAIPAKVGQVLVDAGLAVENGAGPFGAAGGKAGNAGSYQFAAGFTPDQIAKAKMFAANGNMAGLAMLLAATGRNVGAGTSGGFAAGVAPIPGLTSSAMQGGAVAIGSAEWLLRGAAQSAGNALGANFAIGIAQGIRLNTRFIDEAARNAVDGAKQAADERARNSSPSRLFAEVGKNLSLGMAQGMADGKREIVQAAESIVRDAAIATSGIALGFAHEQAQLNSRVASIVGGTGTGGAGGGLSIGAIQVRVDGVADPVMAKAAGRAAADGIVDGLARKKLVTGVRTG